MTPKHEAHLAHIRREGARMLNFRYPQGAEKYGTFLPDMPNLIGEAIEEVLDAFVYLVTARDQVANLHLELNRLRGERAIMLRKLTQALSAKDWALVAEATMGAVEGELHEGKPTVHF